MAVITVDTVIDAPPGAVWIELADLGSHAEWMVDADAVTFVGPRRSGVGTTIDCDTRVGPFRLTDQMEVVEWVEDVAIGVRHRGLVSGEGRFTLSARPGRATELRWREDLRFPWWMGGPLGATAARPVLRLLWRRNLANLRARVEAGPNPG